MATKSKITKFDAKKPFQGVTSAFVTFEDESWGFYEYKGDAPFKEGDEVEYVATKEKTKTGKEIVKLTMTAISGLATSQQSPTVVDEKKNDDTILLPRTGGISQAKTIREMKYEGRIYCLKLAVKCLVARAIEYPQVKQYYTEWVALLDASIDEIKG